MQLHQLGMENTDTEAPPRKFESLKITNTENYAAVKAFLKMKTSRHFFAVGTEINGEVTCQGNLWVLMEHRFAPPTTT